MPIPNARFRQVAAEQAAKMYGERHHKWFWFLYELKKWSATSAVLFLVVYCFFYSLTH